MHWILQDNLFNEAAYQVLLDTLIRFDIPHSIHKVIPFIGELTPEPAQLILCKQNEFLSRMCEEGTKGCNVKHKNVIAMGSYSLRHSAKKFDWAPGVFDLEPFDFQVQMQHWPDDMLNADAVVARFQDAVFTENEMFIRPIQDSKVFAGGLMFKDEFEQWQQKVCVMGEDYGDSLSKDTLIQVCPQKKIYSEHRFWIVKGRIVTCSTYKMGSKVIYKPESEVDERFKAYVSNLTHSMSTKCWCPLEAFVIDVADTDKGLKIVEINTLNSSGFYAADIQKLVMALEGAFNE